MITHTVTIIQGGVETRLTDVPDDVAHRIAEWWKPREDPELVDAFFLEVVKNERGLQRVIGLNRNTVVGLDIQPNQDNDVKPTGPPAAGVQQPVPPPAAPQPASTPGKPQAPAKPIPAPRVPE